MTSYELYQSICGYLTMDLRRVMLRIDPGIAETVHEIRLRAERPVTLFTGEEHLVIERDGQVSSHAGIRSYIITKRELHECFQLICEYSVHTYQEEIKQGFITIRGGHRVGLSGTCIQNSGQISGIKDISSLNIRIARQQFGAADGLLNGLLSQQLSSLLIIGEAGSGKTTLLRDIVRQLADGAGRPPVKVALIDERGELSATYQGVPQNDLGLLTDVYHLYPKARGMSMALRTLSPQVIACDEISSEDDFDAILQSMHSGVYTIATMHGTSLDDVLRRGGLSSFILCGGFEQAVVLEGYHAPCQIKSIEPINREMIP